MMRFIFLYRLIPRPLYYGPFRNHGFGSRFSLGLLSPAVVLTILCVLCILCERTNPKPNLKLKPWFRKGPMTVEVLLYSKKIASRQPPKQSMTDTKNRVANLDRVQRQLI